jgi:hypothetical protein
MRALLNRLLTSPFGAVALSVLTLSVAAQAYDHRPGIYPGAEVISENGNRGFVRGIYGDGTVAVQFGGQATVTRKQIANLAVTQGCDGSFCVGQEIISENGNRGQVHGLYPNHTLAVQFGSDAQTTRKDASKLALTQGCLGDICVLQEVISENGNRARIEGLYQDGYVAARFGSDAQTTRKHASKLALTRGCSGMFCVGTQIISQNGNYGVIQGIYQDGDVAVQFGSDAKTTRKQTATLALVGGGGGGGYPHPHPVPRPPHPVPVPPPHPQPHPQRGYQWVTALASSDIFADLRQDQRFRAQARARCKVRARQTGQNEQVCNQARRVQVGF